MEKPNELTALLALSTRYERARSRKVKLVAKLAAGRIEARVLPPRTREEIKKRRRNKSLNNTNK